MYRFRQHPDAAALQRLLDEGAQHAQVERARLGLGAAPPLPRAGCSSWRGGWSKRASKRSWRSRGSRRSCRACCCTGESRCQSRSRWWPGSSGRCQDFERLPGRHRASLQGVPRGSYGVKAGGVRGLAGGRTANHEACHHPNAGSWRFGIGSSSGLAGRLQIPAFGRAGDGTRGLVQGVADTDDLRTRWM